MNYFLFLFLVLVSFATSLANFFNSLDLIEFKNRLKDFTARNREVVVNVFSENKILEKLLDIVYETGQCIKVRHYSNEILTLSIGESEFKIENSIVQLQDILEDLTLEQKHIIKRIYYFFREFILFFN